MILKLFAGADGAGIGIARALPGVPSVGLELDADACATMAAAGHPVIRCDVEQYPTEPFAGKVTGLWASPPCTDFSVAGKRQMLAGTTGNLIYQVPRWALALRPEWTVCEQTPLALPWWREFARLLEGSGYSTWTGILDAANYGVVSACPLHGRPDEWNQDSAEFAARVSRHATDRASVGAVAMTWSDAEQIADAVTVVAALAKEIELAYAGAATRDERVASLALLARSGIATPTGRAAPSWMTAATCAFGSGAATDGNIALWLSSSWDGLFAKGRLSTTSMAVPTTTIRAISRSIAATLTTGLHTGPASRSGGCSLCVDWAVPQNRKRAILLASRVRHVAPPQPTHAERPFTLFGELLPWVSMADALGWEGVARTGQTTELGAGVRERYERDVRRPAPTIVGRSPGSWTRRRPATTVQATPRIARPGHHDVQWEDSVPVTLEEHATLQDFPPGWPFVGNKTSVARQIGNAVPSRLAEACVRAVAS